MATLGEMNVKIGVDIDDFKAGIQEVEKGVSRLGQGLKSVGAGLTAGITLPLTLVGGAALKAAGDIQALEKGFAATYKGGEDLSAALTKVRDLAKLPGLGLKEALQGATNLQAAGFSADLATRALGAFGNALATVGKGKADLDGVGLALGQIASKGKISAEEINQLAERVPQIREAMKAAFGTADTEVLQKLNIGATEFVEGVTKELQKLPQVLGGINNSFENLSDTGTIALSKLGGALNKSFNVEGNLAKLGDYITELVDKFEALDPATQKTIFVFAGIAAATGPIVFGLGAVLAIIPSVVAGLEVLGIAGAASLGPLGIAALAVGAAAVLIIKNWDVLVAYFTGGPGGKVFGNLADSVSNAAQEIGRAIGALAGSENSLGGLITASGILQQLIQGVAVGFGALADVVGGTIGTITRLLQGDFAGSLQQAKRALFGLIDPLAAVFGFTKKNETALSGSFNAALRPIEEVTGLLGGDLAAAVGKAATLTKEQVDALAKLQKELRDNASNANALGKEYDFLGQKQGILEGGVKSLISAGFAPASAAVRDYAEQLRALNLLLNDPNGPAKPLELKQNIQVKSTLKERPEALAFNKKDRSKDDPFFQLLTDREQRLKEFATNMEGLTANLNAAVAPLLADLATQFGDAFGNILVGTDSASAALGQLFGGITGALASFMGDFGKQLIAIGIGKLGLDTLFSGPQGGPLAIAAGLGLVALSGFTKAVAAQAKSSLGSVGSGGGGSLGSSPRAFTPSVAPGINTQGPASGDKKITVEVKLSGSTAIGLIELERDRLGRVRGGR